MSIVIIIGITAVVGLVATLVELPRDGYRRIPTR